MATTLLPDARYCRDEIPAGCPFTRSELRVIALLAEGLTYKQIALKLDRSPSTVRHHLHTAHRRIGVVDRAQMVLRCEREGWVGDNPRTERSGTEQLFAEIKGILASCAHQLAQGTRHRVTSSQYAYLKAFDATLRRPGVDTDGRMGAALKVVLTDAEVIPSHRRTRKRGYQPKIQEVA